MGSMNEVLVAEKEHEDDFLIRLPNTHPGRVPCTPYSLSSPIQALLLSSLRRNQNICDASGRLLYYNDSIGGDRLSMAFTGFLREQIFTISVYSIST
jgi:hypothetical protein